VPKVFGQGLANMIEHPNQDSINGHHCRIDDNGILCDGQRAEGALLITSIAMVQLLDQVR
jgi:hypothetical protein